MMVTFVSQCQKKALNRTRRVLDAFANRIGDNTWQTIITEDGLVAVKTLLRKTATKNTAVSCHWIRSRSRSELVWVVGDRKRFNAQGIVPVNYTRKILLNNQPENDWHLLPLIKSLSALAALFHDWGKASQCFQAKLQPGKSTQKIGDPLRHEWVSCLLLHAFVNSGDSVADAEWLTRLAAEQFDEPALKTQAAKNNPEPLRGLPKVAGLIAWLVLTHHRLPLPAKNSDEDNRLKGWSDAPDFTELLSMINADFGYANQSTAKERDTCLLFQQGLPNQSMLWLKQAKKWAAKVQECLPLLEQSIEDGSYRLVLHHARLCLMLGDHYYSSQNEPEKWSGNYTPIANTYSKDITLKNQQLIKKGTPKQKLDQHLLGVAKSALNTAYLLPKFEFEFGDEPSLYVYDIKKLKQKSKDDKFQWQDKAVEKIKKWRETENLTTARFGFFAVNMASTGCGKTLANAKIMQALSKQGDSLRFSLALGLRTLTLQTGDEYRCRIGLDNSELAVMIGSRAVQELHQQNQQVPADDDQNGVTGSESAEQLWEDNEVYYECTIPETSLATVLRDDRCKKILYAPVLACTIDHLMAATETKRGGRYILPCLRLMSADLVIDEIDDFDGSDLVAIGRLIHLAGMLGRKVMISSATIPPDLAEGYFNAYQAGWRLFAQTRGAKSQIGCAWIDEFATQIDSIQSADIGRFPLPASRDTRTSLCIVGYQQAHLRFIDKRSKKLQTLTAKRIAEIVNCTQQDDAQGCASVTGGRKPEATSEQDYFAILQQAIISQHQRHAQTDPKTGKQVSFGVVRMANIPPCIRLTEYLAEAAWPETIDIRVMAYHSQQVLLLRSAQEKHLDDVLKRNDPQAAFNNPLIQRHLHNSPANNVIFILVATPVEEVGRDHDFDWAVVEPSSYRSIIQLAGRVLRHRDLIPKTANMALMQFNLKALKKQKPAYCRPGYESEHFRLASHDLQELIPSTQLTCINAVPRIQKNAQPTPDKNLADLEHASINGLLTAYHKKGPHALQGWLTECWWLTAMPQRLSPFRQQDGQLTLYLMPDDKKGWVLKEKTPKGDLNEIEVSYKIEHDQALPPWHKKLWLYRDYGELLDGVVERNKDNGVSMTINYAAMRYGEISVPVYGDELLTGKGYVYSNQLGLCGK